MIRFIGYGNMAKAIAAGLSSSNFDTLYASAPSLQSGTLANGVHTTPSNLVALEEADVIILAVKPQKMASVLNEIAPKIHANTLIISIAAGLNLAWFEKHGLDDCAIVRAMPNVAASIQQSATPLIANSKVTEKQRSQAESLFKHIGVVAWAQDEADFDAFMVLSGSGPAYIYQFIEAMIAAAEHLGLAPESAHAFGMHTALGAINLANGMPSSLQELRRSVTSPGGVTEAILATFKQGNLDALVLQAMQSGLDRNQQLSQLTQG